MFGLKNDEILTYFLLIVVGYCIAKMFSRSCNGFSVGGQSQVNCSTYNNNKKECEKRSNCEWSSGSGDNYYTSTGWSNECKNKPLNNPQRYARINP